MCNFRNNLRLKFNNYQKTPTRNLMFINLLNPILSDKKKEIKSDEDIVKLYLQTQDGRYFDQLYNRYSGKVYGKCISLLKNEEKAADAMQDVFVKILLNLSKFSGKSRFSTWLYSITYNYCIDTIRKKKKDPLVAVDDLTNQHDTAEDVEDSFILETNIARLKVVLEEIPVKDKAILLMKYQDEMSIKEIGSITDKSESAVKMKIKRAKQKFQKVYKEIYKE